MFTNTLKNVLGIKFDPIYSAIRRKPSLKRAIQDFLKWFNVLKLFKGYKVTINYTATGFIKSIVKERIRSKYIYLTKKGSNNTEESKHFFLQRSSK